MSESKRETEHTQDTDKDTMTSNSKVTKLQGPAILLDRQKWAYRTNGKIYTNMWMIKP